MEGKIHIFKRNPYRRGWKIQVLGANLNGINICSTLERVDLPEFMTGINSYFASSTKPPHTGKQTVCEVFFTQIYQALCVK